MPIQLPNLDDRSYRQLVDEMLARVPVHTPEWTQFGEADPGVTLLELFAFLYPARFALPPEFTWSDLS